MINKYLRLKLTIPKTEETIIIDANLKRIYKGKSKKSENDLLINQTEYLIRELFKKYPKINKYE